MATVEELTKELQQAQMMLDVEKQKTRQLEQEVDRLKKKISGGMLGGPSLGTLSSPSASDPLPATRPPRGVSMPSPAQRPVAGEIGGPSDLTSLADGGGGSDEEFAEKKRQLDDLTREKHEVEQRKWTIDKENIALKETLSKLKVQGSNSMKIIEELLEKSDRKENQNFKTRLEITDLRKALNSVKSDREKQEEANARLAHDILTLEAEILHYKAQVDKETQRKDIIQAELNRQQDILGQYQTGFLARFYDK